MEQTIPTTISYNGARRIPYVSLLLGGLALIIHAKGGANGFAFDLLERDWGHSVIAHWAHWSNDHLLWSGGAFVLLGALCEMRDRFTAIALIIASALLISLGVALFPSGMSAYAGLSGIDSAFFGWLVIQMHLTLREKTNAPIKWIPLLCGIGFIAKMTYEFTTGQAFFVHGAVSMMAVPLAHLIGFATGILFGLRIEENE
jgi:hypothetical protein